MVKHLIGPVLLIALFFVVIPTRAQQVAPTPVIAGLGSHTAADGRWFSTVAPYSIVPPKGWLGAEQSDEQGGKNDVFKRSEARYFIIVTGPNAHHLSSAEFSTVVIAQINGSGYTTHEVGNITVKLPTSEVEKVYSFTDDKGSYGVVMFATKSRVWIAALFTGGKYAIGDLKLYQASVSSMKVR